jgi:hypothetical protein
MHQIDPIVQEKHLVILIHGIRTYAYWHEEVRAELERAGFVVELTNYGRFGLFQFLIPIWAFRLSAIDRVREQISAAIRQHAGARVSFIAHSFGTFVLAHILRASLGFRPHRVVFCGSVLPYNFRFGDALASGSFLNEVGRKDYWPALAARVTWGYGAAGTYGFHTPGVRDRYHNNLAHSDFLKLEFCKKYWVDYLREGKIEAGDEHPAGQPALMSLLLFFANKYVAMSLILLVLIWHFGIRSQPITVEITSNGTYAYVGSPIQEVVRAIEHDTRCIPLWFLSFVRQRRCVTLDRMNSATLD